jgi:hypothetical protein
MIVGGAGWPDGGGECEDSLGRDGGDAWLCSRGRLLGGARAGVRWRYLDDLHQVSMAAAVVAWRR